LGKPLPTDFEPARSQVYEALKRGRFYNAIDAAARAKGFRFWGEQGVRTIPMGSSAELTSPIKIYIKAPFRFKKEIHLVRDGKSILRSQEEAISYSAREPGIYRVEIYLKEQTPLRKDIPWIVSNPVFLEENKQ